MTYHQNPEEYTKKQKGLKFSVSFFLLRIKITTDCVLEDKQNGTWAC